MKEIYWDKVRILITNKCNYKCPFCHNEGQAKSFNGDVMSFYDFKLFVDMIKDQSLSEINISGGEPFLNRDIIDMILYLSHSFSCDISCATNLSMITDEDIKKLAGTHVKLNVQFPYISEKLFSRSTGTGDMSLVLSRIEQLKASGICVGLNTVVQSSNAEEYERVILFALDNELPLKFLPQIGSGRGVYYREIIYPILKKYSTSFKDKMSGATRWSLSHKGKSIVVLYVDSPCFAYDIQRCRTYGEIRILPSFYAQPCINKSSGTFLKIRDGKKAVLDQLSDLWMNFTKC